LPVVIVCALAALFTKPGPVAFVELFVIAFLLPAVLTATIIYDHGYRRAFCVGALFPVGALCGVCALTLCNVSSQYWGSVDYVALRWLFGIDWLVAVVSGGLCVGIRFLSQHPDMRIEPAHLRGWGQAVFSLLLILLVLSGPIIGRVGISVGWWQPDAPPAAPVAYGTTNPYVGSASSPYYSNGYTSAQSVEPLDPSAGTAH
jgi:hypothetical protein